MSMSHESNNCSYTMSPPPFLKTREEYQTLLDSVDTFLLDCDGVIYHGPEVVEGVKEVLTMFRDAGMSPASTSKIERLMIRKKGDLCHE